MSATVHEKVVKDYSKMKADPDNNIVVCPDCGRVGKVFRVRASGKAVTHLQVRELGGFQCVRDKDICWLGATKSLVVHPNK